MSKAFTPADVASHNNPEKGLYIIVDSDVYDVTEFINEHPGGSKILKRVAGKDASKQFWKYHNQNVLKKYGPKLKIGEVKDAAKL
ncbi:cytochrome b5, putative [Paecilomyces variotii No. 5]|uniref:Cytochrome b5, putative n=1 Tax=Byssochlamys spectabilis (strain No. 5 / NBRC 109023) TaxID=1356009 RepID=V5I496_BYSSN|nr:cytochrome b5, putative [Paecilomyces variotii No. 5]